MTTMFRRCSLPCWLHRNLLHQNSATRRSVSHTTETSEVLRRLESALSGAVRAHIRQQYPRAFRVIPKEQTDQKSSALSSSWSSQSSKRLDLSPAMTIAQLNGYNVVDIPPHRRVVLMAEGVLARPRQGMFRTGTYTLLGRPSTFSDKRKLPLMVKPDINAYRIIENRVEELLRNMQQSIWQTIQRTIIFPLERVTGRPISLLSSGKTSQDEKEETEMDCLRIHHETGDLQLITHVQPCHATLLTPFELDHKPASTLITVGLVVCGAVPLAYRSWNSMSAYPAFSRVIVASLIGTVFYGIWSSRSVARTNQALAVTKAIVPRIVAQNEAAWLVLQEGATERLVECLLLLYGGQSPPQWDPVTRQEVLSLASQWGLVSDNGKVILSAEKVISKLEKDTLAQDN